MIEIEILIVFYFTKVSVVLEPRGDTGAPDTGHDKHLMLAPLRVKDVKIAMIRNFLISCSVKCPSRETPS